MFNEGPQNPTSKWGLFGGFLPQANFEAPMTLTVAQIKNAKPKDKAYKLADEQGLYVMITPNGSKLWKLKDRCYGSLNIALQELRKSCRLVLFQRFH